ncbi:MAG: class I SAM-dependent methyltransferase [Clostridia bacterium]|nr:class I SAM-dependent methyltransferase [Clostridia bacterium]
MIDLLTLEKSFLLPHIKEGATAVDYTMGNGHDTAFLSKAVGESGKVYAFDIQESALVSTAGNLKSEGCPDNYRLICASHHRVKEFVNEPVKIGMFNLGYLPGGDKRITTLRETTIAAVKAAIDLMDTDAALLIAVYPGHEEGEIEGEMLTELFASYSRYKYCIGKFRLCNSPTSPYFFIIETK